VCFHEIRDFSTLVNKYRMFDEAGKAKVNFYKAVNEKKGNGNDRVKPYYFTLAPQNTLSPETDQNTLLA